MNTVEQQLQEMRQTLMLAMSRSEPQTPHVEGATPWLGIAETDTVLQAATQPWDLSWDGDTVTCSDGVYMRGPVTKDVGDVSLALTKTDLYLAAHVNLAAGTVTLEEGDTLADVTDAAVQDDDATAKVLLYHLVKTDEVWAVAMDYRGMMQLGVRV